MHNQSPLSKADTRIQLDRDTLNRLTAMQRLIHLLGTSLRALGCQPSPQQLEMWSVLIHESMSGRGRSFHTVDHVFDISEGAEALQVLAALFHDTVYYQVDGGLPRKLSEHLADAITITPDGITLTPFDAATDPVREMVVDMFGMKHGQVLSPFAGLNEFLSALLAARAFADILDRPTLARLITCVEATLPFRGSAPGGEEPSEALRGRLAGVNARFGLGFDEEEIDWTLHQAIGLANRDVGNFAFEDAARFLDNTWKLLPETNGPLRSDSVYTISEYRLAIQKMEGFMSFLTPKLVFRTHRGTPDAATYQAMLDRAQRNLTIGVRYLRAKLSAAFLLESIAELTGGCEAPVSFFMGDLPRLSQHPDAVRLEVLLPDPDKDHPIAPDVDPHVMKLLIEGRASEIGFDIKHSPLAAFIYRRAGTAALDAIVQAVKPLTDARARAEKVISLLPADVVARVAEACQKTAVTRVEPLKQIIQACRARDLSART
jgi:hypothetical protein